MDQVIALFHILIAFSFYHWELNFIAAFIKCFEKPMKFYQAYQYSNLLSIKFQSHFDRQMSQITVAIPFLI